MEEENLAEPSRLPDRGAEGPRKPRQEEFIKQSTEAERATQREISGDL